MTRSQGMATRKAINGPALATGLFFTLALGVHVVMGSKEALSLQPEPLNLYRNWIMLLATFHMVTIDLFLLAAGLLYLALKHPFASRVYAGIAAVCLLYGLGFLLQVTLWQRSSADFLYLGQWVLFFLGALGAFAASRKRI